jgi:hypothetical protein
MPSHGLQRPRFSPPGVSGHPNHDAVGRKMPQGVRDKAPATLHDVSEGSVGLMIRVGNQSINLIWLIPR